MKQSSAAVRADIGLRSRRKPSLLILLGQVSSSCSGKSPHPAGTSLLILLGQVSSSLEDKASHPPRTSLLFPRGQTFSSS
ncbi:hypothetical protein F511_00313 [Dorcoceras hygrometricum]|nr:hypothetical protein F511_00313 [Dorcoceras hygrometricum]